MPSAFSRRRSPRRMACAVLGAALLSRIAAIPVAAGGPAPAGLRAQDPGLELLQEFRCAFSPDRCPGTDDAAGGPGIRCLQPQIARFVQIRSTMAPSAISEIESYLLSRRGTRSYGFTYISPLGFCEFTYETAGPDSVPSEDVDPANGVPDFVERCAAYADFCWTTQVGLGFTAPLFPPDGTYDVAFQALGPGAYGYTDVAGQTTTIVLHSSFTGVGFPGNDDPDGPVLGRAKVTLAHELRHASQYTNNGWSEGEPWDELDAAWIEDILYPLTNDYVNFLANNTLSQLDSPWTSMDSTSVTRHGYEDCLWNHYLSGTYGTRIIADLWSLRAAEPAKPMLESYAEVQALYSTNWSESYPKYLEWCWFTGTRALPTVGFADGPQLYRMELTGATSMYPFVVTDTVAALAGHPRRFNKGAATGFPRVLFDGDDSTDDLTVSVIVVEDDSTVTIERPPLGWGNTLDYIAPLRFPEAKYFGVIVTNGSVSGESASYVLQVEDDTVTSVDGAVAGTDASPGGPAFTMAAPAPNPTGEDTWIRWTLRRPGPVSLRILDVSGRVVRTLRVREASGLAESVRWDGRTDRGRHAPSGVYWARLDAGRETVARRLVLLR